MKKMKPNAKKITAALFLTMVMLIFICMLIQAPSILQTLQKENQQEWKESAIFEKMANTFDSIETVMNQTTMARKPLIDVNGFFQRLIDKKIVEDVDSNYIVYKMKNGQLTFLYPEYKDVTVCVENMKALYDHIPKTTKLIYIQAPFKINKYDNQMPAGIKDTTNINADKFVQGLRNYQIPAIDLREAMKDNNFHYSNLFYNTDHHWKTETAFWAYQYVMEYLSQNNQLEYNKALTDENNFNKKEFKQSFLGSQANRTGKYYGGVDDFTLITPNFETKYRINLFDTNLKMISNTSGDFESAFISQRHLSQPNKVKTIRDSSYFGTNPPRGQIINDMVEKGRILIVEDSFGRPFSAFMSLHFNQTDILDLRYYKLHSLTEFIKDKEYDYIFFLYNPGVFNDEDDKAQFTFSS